MIDENTIIPGSTIGIIGGGQLGKMAAMAASELGYKVHIYNDEKDCPAAHSSFKVTAAAYDDKVALEKFAKSVDVITFEFENIPYESVKFLTKYTKVNPNAEFLHMTQNRLREKRFLNTIGVKTAAFEEITSGAKLEEAYKKIGPKCVLKTVEMGYDGKGQYVMDGTLEPRQLWKDLGYKKAILEAFVPYEREISVIVARDKDGASATYMPSENIHKNGILDTTIAPARISDELAQKAWDIAFLIADEVHLIGLLTVEFFLTKDGEFLVNELAPRPHNSGHWTIDACYTSQFEQFIRAVCGLPLASVNYHSNAIMKNLIGDDIESWKDFASDPECKLHIYGKKEARRGRKMGHVTQLITPEDELWDMSE